FLRSIRATLVTAVSLPTSVLVALLGTAIGGFSLNILTLAGLTIAVGRIIDDAIVVLENSYRHLQKGEPPRLAALNGASEVSKAVISSTLTTVAVFLPIALVGGIISKFFVPFSITVTISLIASLLVALTLIPVLVSFLLERRTAPAEGPSQQLGSFETAAAADPGVKLVQVTIASSDFGGYSAGFETNQARLLLLVKDKHQAGAVVGRLQQKLNELYGVGNGQIQTA